MPGLMVSVCGSLASGMLVGCPISLLSMDPERMGVSVDRWLGSPVPPGWTLALSSRKGAKRLSHLRTGGQTRDNRPPSIQEIQGRGATKEIDKITVFSNVVQALAAIYISGRKIKEAARALA
ncbi:hypothetical protein OE88DRAFT_1218655 [Heliocybe sulcata]|uniref:Uncharacterized protein n=1 Tax=Heliocybe sulcata TaxID=5364 RepID=A0A5C3MJ86_9AGAM|nr:hypothetical protein OE88DRAFT_1218655 [Heliocybe sulcata]